MTPKEINEVYEKAFEIAYGSNRVLLLNDPVIDAISKEVKKALGNELVSRIEHLDRNKAIMIVCGDDHLTKGIVDYIWYTHPTKLVSRNAGLCPAYIRLRHRSYSRWTEEQIMSDLFGWQISLKEVYLGTHDYKYKWDYIQFLQNVKGEYQEVFKRLLNLARDYKLGNERMLIVSTDKVDNLPMELSRQFELIRVDAERQDKTVDIPEAKTENVFRWCGGTWEITFDGKTIRPPDSFGLKYIHYLLKHPDKEIYATELRLITGTQLRERSTKSYDEEKKDNEESSGIESGDKMNKILDSTSIEEIKRAIGYLSEQSVGAEEEERAELLDKKTSLEQYLKKATNINADSRDFSTDLEKARKAVSKCITNSLEIIKKEHTTLEQYLSTTIKMGNVFQYKHTSKIDWQLS